MGREIKWVDAGEKFGKLTATGEMKSVSKRGTKPVYFAELICECGKVTLAKRYDLVRGTRTSCGCAKNNNHPGSGCNRMQKIEAGQRFGRLVTTGERKRIPKKSHLGYKSTVGVKCDCGNEVYVYFHNLKSGKTTSCGCLRKEASRQRMNHYALLRGQEEE